jgi:hypothetical protein
MQHSKYIEIIEEYWWEDRYLRRGTSTGESGRWFLELEPSHCI